jgi:lactam utilization protein B
MNELNAIDVNVDMGESFGRWSLGDDASLMPHISSANIACGTQAILARCAGPSPQPWSTTCR